MKEGGFTFYFFIYFLYVNACGMHMCVCGVGVEPRGGWWVSCYTILDNITLGLGFLLNQGLGWWPPSLTNPPFLSTTTL